MGRGAIAIFIVGIFYWYRSYRICAYAVMSHHMHVVLCVDKDLADNWSMEEVIKRWHQLYQGTLLSRKYQRGDKLSKSIKVNRGQNKVKLTLCHTRLHLVGNLSKV